MQRTITPCGKNIKTTWKVQDDLGEKIINECGKDNTNAKRKPHQCEHQCEQHQCGSNQEKIKTKNTTKAKTTWKKHNQKKKKKPCREKSSFSHSFLFFPYATLNNTSISLAGDYCLGALKWNTLKIIWRFYEKTYSILQKN